MRSRWFRILLLLTVLAAPAAVGEMLPGFRIELISETSGFVSSLAISPADEIYYSTTDGYVVRLDGTDRVDVALVPTANDGNAALLGIAFRSPEEIVAHFVTPDLTADIVGTVDLLTGTQSVLAAFLCDSGRPCSSEHHGGNLIIDPDMNVIFGIGDMGGGSIAQVKTSPAGKLFRIRSTTDVEMYALGLRNPFDMAFDSSTGKVIVADNGPVGEDEIHIISKGDNCGWPHTVGNLPPVEGMSEPVYVWPDTVAPTGLILVEGPMPVRPGGLLIGSFVTSALYYFPDLIGTPLADPVVILSEETPPIIDVAQNSRGEIFFAAPFAIYRLHLPIAGDGDGNGVVEEADVLAIVREIDDGDGPLTVRAGGGEFRGSWGADVNRDGFIDSNDVAAFAKMVSGRRRPVRR